MMRYSYTVHVSIEQINKDQFNTIIETYLPIEV